jgi:hypothetical protein
LPQPRNHSLAAAAATLFCFSSFKKKPMDLDNVGSIDSDA